MYVIKWVVSRSGMAEIADKYRKAGYRNEI